MEVEYDIKVIPISDPHRFTAELDKIAKEGYVLVPGVQPVAIYHLVRQKPAQMPITSPMANATMTIDDSKIGIIRNGKLIS